MRVTLLEAWRALYDGNAREVILPGEDGEVCVLDFHEPFCYRLRRGVIHIREPRSPTTACRVLIRDGIARMAGNQLILLVKV